MKRLTLLFLASCAAAPPPSPTPTPTPTPTSTSTDWPLTVAEKAGQAYVYDTTVADSRPCPAGSAPLILRLFFRALLNPALRATMKSCSSKELRVLHDASLQPSILELTSPTGQLAPSSDSRAVSKFDDTVYSASFHPFAPGEERVIEEAPLLATQGAYRAHWLSFDFSNLAPGVWKARVTFESNVVEAVEGYRASAMKKVRVPNAWVGKIASNEVTFTLP
jgi:hypothetical protein